MDSAFWDARRADTASELSWWTVAWASSVISITPPPMLDSEDVWAWEGPTGHTKETELTQRGMIMMKVDSSL